MDWVKKESREGRYWNELSRSTDVVKDKKKTKNDTFGCIGVKKWDRLSRTRLTNSVQWTPQMIHKSIYSTEYMQHLHYCALCSIKIAISKCHRSFCEFYYYHCDDIDLLFYLPENDFFMHTEIFFVLFCSKKSLCVHHLTTLHFSSDFFLVIIVFVLRRIFDILFL